MRVNMPKSSKQLDRDIAEAALYGPSREIAEPPWSTEDSDEDLLLVANDAALEGRSTEVDKLLKKLKPRKVVEKRGFPEFAEPLLVTAHAVFISKNGRGSSTPVTAAFVREAVKWLRKHKATKVHKGSNYAGRALYWYSVPRRDKEFYLRNFTDQEEQGIFLAMSRK